MEPTKVALIAKLPPANLVKDVRSFLGHAWFYKIFMRDVSKMA